MIKKSQIKDFHNKGAEETFTRPEPSVQPGGKLN